MEGEKLSTRQRIVATKLALVEQPDSVDLKEKLKELLRVHMHVELPKRDRLVQELVALEKEKENDKNFKWCINAMSLCPFCRAPLERGFRHVQLLSEIKALS